LANGCLCCSIKDAGVAAIEKLMQRKGAFDHILLETTGLADPGGHSTACLRLPIYYNFHIFRPHRFHVLA
jgi:G3E family GTPase